MDSLRYSTRGIVTQCLLVLVTGVMIGGLLFLPSHGNPAPNVRLGPVMTAVLLVLIFYGAIVQLVRTWLLLGNDRAALKLTAHGIDLHGAWVRRSFVWNDIKSVALVRRSARNGHYFVVSVQCSSGWKKRFDVRTRLLEGSTEEIGSWADRAEAELLKHGGTPVAAPTGWLSAWFFRRNQAAIAKARQASID